MIKYFLVLNFFFKIEEEAMYYVIFHNRFLIVT